DLGGREVIDVSADVVLDPRIAADVGADLRENLVPGAADAGLEEAAQRAEVLVERPPPGDALPVRFPLGLIFPLQPVGRLAVPLPGLLVARAGTRPFDDHLVHVCTHTVLTRPPPFGSTPSLTRSVAQRFAPGKLNVIPRRFTIFWSGQEQPT